MDVMPKSNVVSYNDVSNYVLKLERTNFRLQAYENVHI